MDIAFWKWKWNYPYILSSISTDGVWAIGSGRGLGSVMILNVLEPDAPTQGTGDHSTAITATSISSLGLVACSCSSDAIVFWDLKLMGSGTSSTRWNGRLLPITISSSVCDAKFSPSGTLVAIVDEGTAALLFDTRRGLLTSVLNHRRCAASAFTRENFITIGEDGSFCIWSGEGYTSLSYQSSIFCASPMASIATDWEGSRFAIASVDGHIYLFDAVSSLESRFIGRLNLFWQINDEAEQSRYDPDEDDSLIMSMTLINMIWLHISETVSAIAVVTSTSACLINAENFDTIARYEISVPDTCAVFVSWPEVVFIVSAAFSGTVSALTLDVCQALDSLNTNIKIMSSAAIPEDSPLTNLTFTSKAKRIGKHKPLDRPILFHSRVKSSGYGQIEQPRRKMFTKPFTNKVKRSIKSEQQHARNVPGRNYPVDCGIICRPQRLPSPRESHKGPVNYSAFSGNGQQFLTCSTDGCTRVHRLKTPTSQILTGHTSGVKTCHWNSDSTMIATASADHTVAIYSLPRLDPVCLVTHVFHNLPGKVTTGNKCFPSEINEARFFHADQLLSLCCRNEIGLYKFRIGTANYDLSRPYQDYRFSRVAVFQHNADSNGMITCMAARNCSDSHIIIGATRNRELLVIDMATGGTLLNNISNAHGRPVHTICMAEGSSNTSSTMTNMFCSAAPDGIIKLWDVRVRGAVRRYAGHVNRQKQIGVAVSPCLRYIAAGSEDNQTYIYDIGSGRWLERFRGHRDTVSTISYSPTKPLLVSGAYDGTISCFTAR